MRKTNVRHTSSKPLSGLARAWYRQDGLKEPEAEQLISQAHPEKHSLIEQIIASQKISSLDLPVSWLTPLAIRCSIWLFSMKRTFRQMPSTAS